MAPELAGKNDGKTITGGTKLEFMPAPQPHHGASATTPHTAITAPFGWWSSKPALQYPLARKQASELNLGWNRMSNGADCRAGRRGWEEAAEREKEIIL